MPKLEAGCGVDLVAFVTGGGGEQARGGGFYYRFTIKTVSMYYRFPVKTVSTHYRFPINTVSIYYRLNQIRWRHGSGRCHSRRWRQPSTRGRLLLSIYYQKTIDLLSIPYQDSFDLLSPKPKSGGGVDPIALVPGGGGKQVCGGGARQGCHCFEAPRMVPTPPGPP